MSLNPEQERWLETRKESAMENFKIGDKVVVYGTAEIDGVSREAISKEIKYTVVYRDEAGKYLGSATVPASLLEHDAVFHRVAS